MIWRILENLGGAFDVFRLLLNFRGLQWFTSFYNIPQYSTLKWGTYGDSAMATVHLSVLKPPFC